MHCALYCILTCTHSYYQGIERLKCYTERSKRPCKICKWQRQRTISDDGEGPACNWVYKMMQWWYHLYFSRTVFIHTSFTKKCWPSISWKLINVSREHDGTGTHQILLWSCTYVSPFTIIINIKIITIIISRSRSRISDIKCCSIYAMQQQDVDFSLTFPSCLSHPTLILLVMKGVIFQTLILFYLL